LTVPQKVTRQPDIHIYHEGHEEHEVEVIMFVCSPFMFFMIFMVNLKVLRVHQFFLSSSNSLYRRLLERSGNPPGRKQNISFLDGHGWESLA